MVLCDTLYVIPEMPESSCSSFTVLHAHSGPCCGSQFVCVCNLDRES